MSILLDTPDSEKVAQLLKGSPKKMQPSGSYTQEIGLLPIAGGRDSFKGVSPHVLVGNCVLICEASKRFWDKNAPHVVRVVWDADLISEDDGLRLVEDAGQILLPEVFLFFVRPTHEAEDVSRLLWVMATQGGPFVFSGASGRSPHPIRDILGNLTLFGEVVAVAAAPALTGEAAEMMRRSMVRGSISQGWFL